MIMGHENCSREKFDKYYAPNIEDKFKRGYGFIVGGGASFDAMAHEQLDSLGATNVIVFDEGDKDGLGAVAKGWNLRNGFKYHSECDDAMLREASDVIVYLFGEEVQCTWTFRNLLQFADMAWDDPLTANDYVTIARRHTRGTTIFSTDSWEGGNFFDFEDTSAVD